VTPEELLIGAFEQRSTPTAFRNISRKAVADGLRDRIVDPSKIDQKSASLCGPAALVYDLASHDRVAYVTFVTKLYEEGHARLGKWEVDPSDKLEGFTLPASATIEPVDWIPLASIRNTSKFMFARYDEAGEKLAAPVLAGRFEKWLKNTGYATVVRQTDYLRPLRKSAELAEAERYLRLGYSVFLFVNGKGFERLTEEHNAVCSAPNSVVTDHYGFGITPTHWVVLKSVSWNGGNLVKLSVYTWGEVRSIPDCGWVEYKKVKRHYFGFVAAKH